MHYPYLYGTSKSFGISTRGHNYDLHYPLRRKWMKGQFMYQRNAAPLLPRDAAGAVGVADHSLCVVCTGTLQCVSVHLCSHEVTSANNYELKRICFNVHFQWSVYWKHLACFSYIYTQWWFTSIKLFSLYHMFTYSMMIYINWIIFSGPHVYFVMKIWVCKDLGKNIMIFLIFLMKVFSPLLLS